MISGFSVRDFSGPCLKLVSRCAGSKRNERTELTATTASKAEDDEDQYRENSCFLAGAYVRTHGLTANPLKEGAKWLSGAVVCVEL